MPVQIEEIIVNAVVENLAGESGQPNHTGNDNSRENIIKICVEKVLDILNKKNER